MLTCLLTSAEIRRDTQRAGYMPSDNPRVAASEALSFLSKH